VFSRICVVLGKMKKTEGRLHAIFGFLVSGQFSSANGPFSSVKISGVCGLPRVICR